LYLSFIKQIQAGKIKSADLVSSIQNFINDFENDFQQTWRENEENEEQNGEAIEGIITKGLYAKLIDIYDTDRDKNLDYLFRVYDFISLAHLECDPDIIIPASLEHAIERKS
jgi:hypothetical protein